MKKYVLLILFTLAALMAVLLFISNRQNQLYSYPDYIITDDITLPHSTWQQACESIEVYVGDEYKEREKLCIFLEEIPANRHLHARSHNMAEAQEMLNFIRRGVSLNEPLLRTTQKGFTYHIILGFGGTSSKAYLEAFVPSIAKNTVLIYPRSDSTCFRCDGLISFLDKYKGSPRAVNKRVPSKE